MGTLLLFKDVVIDDRCVNDNGAGTIDTVMPIALHAASNYHIDKGPGSWVFGCRSFRLDNKRSM